MTHKETFSFVETFRQAREAMRAPAGEDRTPTEPAALDPWSAFVIGILCGAMIGVAAGAALMSAAH